jgi:hypothetical protein
MRKILVSLMLALSSLTCSAAILSCDELIDKVSKRLESKGISDYQLTAVAIKEDHPGKEVGTCQGGTQKVMYERGKAAEKKDKE